MLLEFVMKSVKVTNLFFRIFVFISFILQVNGSLLSRLKNRYEYLPLDTEDFTVEDMNYIVDEPSMMNSNSTEIISTPSAFGSDDLITNQYYEPSFPRTVVTRGATFYSEIRSVTEERDFRKQTSSSVADLYYYDQEKWPPIKLFVALRSTHLHQKTSASAPKKHRNRTWPSYFPPKLISKLQAELDDALLPWKATTAIPTTVTTNDSAYLKESLIKTFAPNEIYGFHASCYMCGLDQPGIPRMPGCYHIFDSDDHRNRKLQRRLRVKCIQSDVKKTIKHKHYGPDYIGGCFKRFLDVGIEYNERGCRTVEPTKGLSYASRRLAYLERMLKDKENGCAFSPYASLTPFSRAISLYARYHVCVCDKKYCNHASRTLPTNLYKLFSLAVYFLL